MLPLGQEAIAVSLACLVAATSSIAEPGAIVWLPMAGF